jgi:hypothetical protein
MRRARVIGGVLGAALIACAAWACGAHAEASAALDPIALLEVSSTSTSAEPALDATATHGFGPGAASDATPAYDEISAFAWAVEATPGLAVETQPSATATPGSTGSLGAERAQVLLRSLTVPGWGQATMGLKTSAWVFGLTELGIWTTFAAFRIQEQMRTDSYELTARLQAGINLHGRDEEFRRIVGSYISSDEYNQLVVYRDAANLYYDNPAAYNAYIAEHELKGSDVWAWSDVDGLLRYRGQRKDAQRAEIRSNTCLAAAVVNRLLSAVHAARASARIGKHKQAWNLEAVPVEGSDATAFRFGVRTRF